MQRLILPSSEIYPFQLEVDKIDIEQGRRLAGVGYDFLKVPPIPVYKIPEEFHRNSWKYILPDGNKRWLFSHSTAGKVATILLQSDEEIQIEAWGMAPFRHAAHPRIYERTLGIYCYQENINYDKNFSSPSFSLAPL